MGETIVGKDSTRVFSNMKKVERVYILKKMVTFASTLVKPFGTYAVCPNCKGRWRFVDFFFFFWLWIGLYAHLKRKRK